MRFDLDAERDLGELIRLTFELFGRHLAVFLSLTLLVVAPIELAVDGVWGRYLADGGDANPSTGAATTSTLLGVVVIPPLVTALLVVVVQASARGEEPTVGAALRVAGPRLLLALCAVALYSAAVAAGAVAFIVPGVWLAVRWYFCAQAVVAERRGPIDALRRSADVVETRWWRTFGYLVAFGLVVTVLALVGDAIARQIQNGPIFTTASIVIQTATLSLTAIFGTLLFFDSRARTGRSLVHLG